MQYSLNHSSTRFVSIELKITQFPSGFCLKIYCILLSKEMLSEVPNRTVLIWHPSFQKKKNSWSWVIKCGITVTTMPDTATMGASHSKEGCVSLGWSGSGSVILDLLDHGRSNEPMNPCSEWIHRFIWVVYHLHGQTGGFMVWVNGSQSSGLVNFVPESPLPFVQISSNYRKKSREGLKLVSKMALKEWNTNFRLEYSIWKNRTNFCRCSVAPGNFPLGRPKKLCSIYFPTGFPENFCKW